MLITYAADKYPSREDLVDLYDAVEWAAYTNDPDRLASTAAASFTVATARDESGMLVGLALVVGDGMTIAYLQDVLVRPSHQRHGIAREWRRRAFEPSADVRQKVLMTDDEPERRAFYESIGFTEVRELPFPIRVFARLE
ncbi:GNAT family N-acetyltransferase [Microbacterium sp. YY-03]|uniref:GNAT family N-acetyltransferase n=1 Tax=Microbacterium sp. YY-03 TaxID=3421636 RepID=UPI003D17CBF8